MNEELPITQCPALRSCWAFMIIITLIIFFFYNSPRQLQSVIYTFLTGKPLLVSSVPAVPEKGSTYVRGKEAEELFHPIVLEAANRHQIDPALVKAVIMAESGYNPRAVSQKGAEGLMQLMPETARALGVEDSFNPEHNINAGVKYLKHLMNQFDGDTRLALAAYNAGSRKVKLYQGVPPFGATKRYIKKVFRYYEYYKEEMKAEVTRA